VPAARGGRGGAFILPAFATGHRQIFDCHCREWSDNEERQPLISNIPHRHSPANRRGFYGEGLKCEFSHFHGEIADFAEFGMMSANALADCRAVQTPCNGVKSSTEAIALIRDLRPKFWRLARKGVAAEFDGAAAREEKAARRWCLSGIPREENLGFVGPTAGGKIFMAD